MSGVITDDHGQALLIQRREVREETWLDIEPDTLSGVYKNMSRGIGALVFRGEATGGQLTINDGTRLKALPT